MTRLDQKFNKLDYPPRPIENASMKKLVSLVCVPFMGMCAVGNLRAETQPADAERYGPYPTNYREIVMKWLDTQLIAAGSARIEWNGAPKPPYLGTKEKHLYRYLLKFK